MGKPLVALPNRIPETGDLYVDRESVDVYAKHAQRGFVALWERLFIKDIVRRFHEQPPLRVLDIGTGPGWIPTRLALARPGWSILGLDASAAMIACAKRNASAHEASVQWLLAKGDVTGLADAQCDLVISHFALHEFSDPAATLMEIARILKPGGTLILHDLCRPPRALIPALHVLHILLTFSLAFSRQYADSLRAAYTRTEVQALVDASPLTGTASTLYGGSQLRVQAINGSPA